jgi:hypothetical protein
MQISFSPPLASSPILVLLNPYDMPKTCMAQIYWKKKEKASNAKI